MMPVSMMPVSFLQNKRYFPLYVLTVHYKTRRAKTYFYLDCTYYTPSALFHLYNLAFRNCLVFPVSLFFMNLCDARPYDAGFGKYKFGGGAGYLLAVLN